jgi:hypothetical protein
MDYEGNAERKRERMGELLKSVSATGESNRTRPSRSTGGSPKHGSGWHKQLRTTHSKGVRIGLAPLDLPNCQKNGSVAMIDMMR